MTIISKPTPPTLDVIVPTYNEEACVPQLIAQIARLRRELVKTLQLRLIIVDDGSTDGTRGILRGISETESWINLVFLTRNFGHQTAVSAGMDKSTADYVAVIDADLQDSPELLVPMYEKLIAENLDIVFGQRIRREGEKFFKRFSATVFYRVLRRVSGFEIPLDAGDFRIMTKRSNELIRSMSERNRYLRGLAAWTGLKAAPYFYHRRPRIAGNTKYSFRKMLGLALNGISALSVTPIRFIQLMGVLVLLSGGVLLLLTPILDIKYSFEALELVQMSLIFVSSGLSLTAIGVVGGYVHRIQDEVRGRPLYVTEEDYGR